jgi:hypothetical protein
VQVQSSKVLIYDAPSESEARYCSTQGKSSTSSLATAPEMLASEVTLGFLSGEEPDTHQFNVTVVKFGDQMEINSMMRFQL